MGAFGGITCGKWVVWGIDWEWARGMLGNEYFLFEIGFDGVLADGGLCDFRGEAFGDSGAGGFGAVCGQVA